MSLWRIFPAAADCQAWCDQAFATMVRDRAAGYGGMLNDFGAPGRPPVDVTVLADADLTGDRFPLLGMRAGEWQWDDGHTTAWAEPRQTADGNWAAPCLDPNDPDGQPEPAWPDPGPI